MDFHNLTAIYPYSIYDVETKRQLREFTSLLWSNESCVQCLSREPEGFQQNERFRFQACICRLMEDRERGRDHSGERRKERESYRKLVMLVCCLLCMCVCVEV